MALRALDGRVKPGHDIWDGAHTLSLCAKAGHDIWREMRVRASNVFLSIFNNLLADYQYV